VIFLGAGFSFIAGVPLASQLFDRRPEVDRITRQKLVERVLERWQIRIRPRRDSYEKPLDENAIAAFPMNLI
jgi:hypothetical protein